MNQKKVVFLSVYAVLGAAMIAAALRMEGYYQSLMFASGVGMALSAAGNLLREYRNTRPENRAKYERKRKEQSINLKDERKVFLRYKAAYRTMQLTIFGGYFGAALLAWLRADAKVICALFGVAIAEYVVASILYKYYCAKL